MGGRFVAFSQAYKHLFEFVPGFVSVVALKYMHNIFDRLSTVSRSFSGGQFPYFFHDYNSGYFLVSRSFRPFVLAVGSFYRGEGKCGPIYLLLCPFMYSVNYMLKIHKKGPED